MKRPWEDNSIAANGAAVRDNFAKWFIGSAIVDADGLPLLLFHGTRKAFDEFDRKRSRNWADNNCLGHFFTRFSGSAGGYAGDEPGANIVPVYLRMKNPYIQHVYEWQDMQSNSPRWPRERILQWRKDLISKGHDGIVDSVGADFIAFNAKQIKSAIGNAGLYLPGSASLTDSVAAETLLQAKKAAAAVAKVSSAPKELARCAP